MRINFKSWMPHIVAIVLFALVPIIYFFPALKGMALHQGDIDNFLGTAKEMMDFRARFHTESLWTNSVFCGMPTFQMGALYPANLMQYLYIGLVKWLPFPGGIVFLYCLGFYILLNVLKVDSWVSIIGSFAFGYSSFLFIILAAGHNSEANAIAFMAPVLAGVILAFNGKRIAGGVFTGVALALELYASHLQITYYLLLTLIIYGIAQFITSIRNKQIPGFFKTMGVLIIAAGLAVSTNITNLWLTYEYGKFSTRGKPELTFNNQNKSTGLTKEYATAWCYGVGESMTLLIPDFKGGASDPIGEVAHVPNGLDEQQGQIFANFSQYFGDQPFTSGPVYAGAIVCFLAFMGLFLVKGPFKWFLVVATFLSVALSWGKNSAFIFGTSIFDFFFDHVPGFNNFRSVSMVLVIAGLTLPILAAMAIDRILKEKDFMKNSIPVKFFKNLSGKKIFFISVGIAGGIALLCAIMPSMFSNFQSPVEYNRWVQRLKEGSQGASEGQIQQYLDNIYPYVEQARKSIFVSDAWRTAIFIILAGGLIWVYSRKLITRNWFVGVLLFFVVIDMSVVDLRYLDQSKRYWSSKKAVKVPFEPDQADLQIMQDTSLDYRVYNTTAPPDQDSRTSYFHKSLGGYSGVKMKRYDDLLNLINEHDTSVINMLNAKYIIFSGKDGQPVAQRNPSAHGNAWFVNSYKLVANADSEYLGLVNFNPVQTAIVDQKFAGYLANAHLTRDSTAAIKLISYEPNDLVYTSHANSGQLAVFSEIYYKDGWDAYIDGVPSDYIRANYVLRAMLIPSGNHKIEFKFQPKEYAIGEKVSFASSLILLLGCLALLIQQLRKPQEQ